MAVKGLDIFKLSPKTNCKECGCPTCMAFCMKVAQGALPIDKCPHMSDEAKALLSEATAPPMKTIKIGTGEGEHTLGGETVLYRHEKTFVSRNIFAAPLCTCMDDAEIDAKLNAIGKVDYERIGEREYVETIMVHGDDAARLAELAEKASATGRTVIIDTTDVDAAKAAVTAIADKKPALIGANKDNLEAMNEIASANGIALGVIGADLAEIHDTVAALEAKGNKNLIIDVTGADIKETLKNRGLKTHFEFLIPDFAVPLRTNRRLFQPSFAVLPNEARTASMAALRKPFLSNAATPSMVVPPGLHTASFSSPGCFPVSSTMAALPRSMAAA